MNTQLANINLNPEDFGLEESKVGHIVSAFLPMLNRMTDLERDYDAVTALEVSEETCAKAKDLRLDYVKLRTGTAKIHKELKADSLAVGKFIDKWKNAQVYATETIEEDLKEIETHYERIEQEKKHKLLLERSRITSKYMEEPPVGVEDMEEEVFEAFIQGLEAQKQARFAEQEKLEKAQADYDLLSKRKQEISMYLAFTPKSVPTVETTEEEFQEIIKDLQAQQKAYDEENARLKEKAKALAEAAEEKEKKLLAARLKQQELQQTIDDEIARKEKIKAEQLEREEAAKSAGDDEKLEQFRLAIRGITIPEVESKRAQEIITRIADVLERAEAYIINN